MALTRRRLIELAGLAGAASIVPAAAQDWPSRPVRILVGTAAGGSPDIVSRIIGEISEASANQATTLGEIGQAVQQLDQMTQQNAALVEEATAAAESLREQASGLVQSVASFRLP